MRQDDSLSPYLFVIAIEVLSACIAQVISSPDFGYHWRTKDARISHLISADDVFLVGKRDSNSIRLLLLGVRNFFRISSLSPNPAKCLCFFGNVPVETQQFALQFSGFSRGSLPLSGIATNLGSASYQGL